MSKSESQPVPNEHRTMGGDLDAGIEPGSDLEFGSRPDTEQPTGNKAMDAAVELYGDMFGQSAVDELLAAEQRQKQYGIDKARKALQESKLEPLVSTEKKESTEPELGSAEYFWNQHDRDLLDQAMKDDPGLDREQVTGWADELREWEGIDRSGYGSNYPTADKLDMKTLNEARQFVAREQAAFDESPLDPEVLEKLKIDKWHIVSGRYTNAERHDRFDRYLEAVKAGDMEPIEAMLDEWERRGEKVGENEPEAETSDGEDAPEQPDAEEVGPETKEESETSQPASPDQHPANGFERKIGKLLNDLEPAWNETKRYFKTDSLASKLRHMSKGMKIALGAVLAVGTVTGGPLWLAIPGGAYVVGEAGRRLYLQGKSALRSMKSKAKR